MRINPSFQVQVKATKRKQGFGEGLPNFTQTHNLFNRLMHTQFLYLYMWCEVQLLLSPVLNILCFKEGENYFILCCSLLLWFLIEEKFISLYSRFIWKWMSRLDGNSHTQSRKPNGKHIHVMSSRFCQLKPSVGCYYAPRLSIINVTIWKLCSYVMVCTMHWPWTQLYH